MAYDPYSEFNPQVGAPMSVNQQPNFSWQSRAMNGMQGLMGNRDLALALLSNSGPTTQRQSFGQILGNSMMQADQAKQQRTDDEFKRAYMMAQMQRMQQQGTNQFGAVQPDKFTPESIAKFEQTGKYSDLQLRPIGMQTGRYNPGDFTPESWANFLSTQDPSTLVRYVAPQNATIVDMNGAPTAVQPDKTGKTPPRITPLTTPEAQRDAAMRLKASEAMGSVAGDQAGKQPIKASLDYVVSGFEPLIQKTMQGGLFGYKGKAGKVLDKKDREQFLNQREQLSTELRAIFRIPGEGSLSDREQAQYGIQLPDPDNEPETNIKILKDVQERARLRTETPIGNSASPVAAPSKKKRYNPATGKIE